MKYKAGPNSTYGYHELVLKKLEKLGYEIQILTDTDVIIVEKNDKKHFFIAQYTPLTTHSAALVLTNHHYPKFLFRTKKINYADHYVYSRGKTALEDTNLFRYPVSVAIDDPVSSLSNEVVKTSNKLRKLLLRQKYLDSRIIINERYHWKFRMCIYVDTNGNIQTLGKNNLKLKDNPRDLTKILASGFKQLSLDILSCFPRLPQASLVINTDGIEKLGDYSLETIYPSPIRHYKYKVGVNYHNNQTVADLTVGYIFSKDQPGIDYSP